MTLEGYLRSGLISTRKLSAKDWSRIDRAAVLANAMRLDKRSSIVYFKNERERLAWFAVAIERDLHCPPELAASHARAIYQVLMEEWND
jgi:hypothetical protein